MNLQFSLLRKYLDGICDGKPGRLKKMSNNLADGYYSSTLKIRRDYWDAKKKSNLIEG